MLALASRIGEVVAEVAPDPPHDTLRPVFARATAAGSTVYTGTYGAHGLLPAAGYHHETVNHAQGVCARSVVCDNPAESPWSLWRPYHAAFGGAAERNVATCVRVFRFRRNCCHLDAFGTGQLVPAALPHDAEQQAQALVRLV